MYFDNNLFLKNNLMNITGFIANITDKKINATDITATYDNLSSSNIRKAVYNGDVKAEKYILLYLYDPKKENISLEFLNEYGARLNNRLKADILLFTIYTKESFDAWSDKLSDNAHKKLIEQYEMQEDSKPKYELMRKLAVDYKVSHSLPALVVIDGKGKDGYQEMFTSVSFKEYYTTKNIFNKISDILDAIEDNPNNFEVIRQICDGIIKYNSNNFFEFYQQNDPMSLYNFFDNAIKRIGDTIQGCATATDMTRNTLSDYMYGKRRIKLKYIFALALHLQLSPKELDWVISVCAEETPTKINEVINGNDDTYREVKSCLQKGMGEVESLSYLYEKGIKLKTVKKPKKNSFNYADNLKDWEEEQLF